MSNEIITNEMLNNLKSDIETISSIINTPAMQKVRTRKGLEYYGLATINNIVEANDIASIKKYKAKGDGLTDDTQAFIDLEKDYQSQIIDLLGKTYAVDMLPTKNTYKNGKFFVDDGVTLTFKPPKKTPSRKTAWRSGTTGVLIGRLDHKSYPKTDVVSIKVSQGTCYDLKTNEFFTLMIDAYDTTQHYIEKHALTRRVNSLKAESEKTKDINHQGLDLCYVNGVRKFFTVGGSDSNYDIVQFEWDGTSNSQLTNKKVFKLFPDDINNGAEIGIDKTIPNTIGISPNGHFLATTTHYKLRSGKNGYYVRVFDTSVFGESGDYSNDYLFEFPIHRKFGENNTIQAIATDGEFVYVMQSNTDKSIDVHVYTLDGTLVQYDENSKIGYQFNVSSDSYEPETFLWISSPQGIQLAVGNHTWKSNTDSDQVCTNIVTPQSHGVTIFNKIDSTTAPIVTDAIAFDSEKNLELIVNYASVNYSRALLTDKDLTLKGNSSRSFVNVENNLGSGDVGYSVKNGLRNGAFQVSLSGNLGIYDYTNAKWSFYTNIAGTRSYLESELRINGTLYPAAAFECGTNDQKWKRVTSSEFAFSQNVYTSSGNGSPEGVVAAGIGSIYINTLGGSGSTFYVKESGTGNTGWVAK